jgi:hypothetical protein
MKATTQTITFGGRTATVMTEGSLEHVKNFDALSPSGSGLADDEWPYALNAKRYHTRAWELFRLALRSRDCEAIIHAAKRLPSVRVRLETQHFLNPNYGFVVSRGNWTLFLAPIVSVQ